MDKNIIQLAGEGKPIVVLTEEHEAVTGDGVEINGPAKVFLHKGKMMMHTSAPITVINTKTDSKTNIP